MCAANDVVCRYPVSELPRKRDLINTLVKVQSVKFGFTDDFYIYIYILLYTLISV